MGIQSKGNFVGLSRGVVVGFKVIGEEVGFESGDG